MTAASNFSLTNKTKGKLPRLPFALMKDFALGADYELSVAFVGPTESQRLNKQWRGKDKPTNVLSFPLSETAGEIIICPSKAKKEAPDFDQSYSNFIAFLFIHGLLHLKGFDHGSKMESEEQRVRTRFKINS